MWFGCDVHAYTPNNDFGAAFEAVLSHRAAMRCFEVVLGALQYLDVRRPRRREVGSALAGHVLRTANAKLFVHVERLFARRLVVTTVRIALPKLALSDI